jgi:micrococcal nuclease
LNGEGAVKKVLRLSFIGIVLAFSLIACRKTPARPPGLTEALVTKVIDGDTIEVEIEGKSYKVRYIGIDTPELHHPERPVEYYAQEAYEKNKELVEGKMVLLKKDISETDSYGRLLRYVYVGDVFVNAYLVQHGYALVATYPPDVKYQEYFLELQREAREAGRGLWGPILTLPSPGQVIIDPDCSQFDAPGNDHFNLNEEYVCFTSQSDHPVDMTGWRVNKRPNMWYTFPEFILKPGASVRLHSGAETNTATDLYWGSGKAIWRNIHDSVYLYDADGGLIDEYSW